MRRSTTFLTVSALLLVAACTRTIIVRQPAPDTERRGSRPPPRNYPEPERPADPSPPRSTAATLGIPPGHLPDPGECRVWIPGTPPGQQPRPRSRPCPGIAAYAPAGSWIIYRPAEDRRLVHVRVVDERRPGFVIRIRIFDIATERLLREEIAQDEPGQNDRPREERPRDDVATLGLPPGHLPEPGQCRVWIPGTPPGQQPPPRSRPCEGIAAIAPAGSWIVYRPTDDRRLVHVRIVDERRPGVVVRIRIFDIATERLLREEMPQEERPRGQPPTEDRPLNQRPDIQRPPEQQPPPVQPPANKPPEQQAPPVQPPANKPPEQQPPPVQPPENKPPEQRPPDNRPGEEPRGPNRAAALDVPPGHLPEPGECRVWIPGMPPGQQPRPKSRPCAGMAAAAPAGSWILYRPSEDTKVVHVRVVDERRAGVVIRVQVFDIATGQLVREEHP